MTLNEKQEKIIALIEAFLFHYGESVKIENIAKTLDISESDCREAVEILTCRKEEDVTSGLCLVLHGNSVQLATKPNLQEARTKLVEREWKAELTPAAQETLSIIAYAGPISKIMIDYIRGVNSGFTLRSLLVRGLVEREPSKEYAHSYDYMVSTEFLRHMGITNLQTLPEYEKYHKVLLEFAKNDSETPATPVVALTDA